MLSLLEDALTGMQRKRDRQTMLDGGKDENVDDRAAANHRVGDNSSNYGTCFHVYPTAKIFI